MKLIFKMLLNIESNSSKNFKCYLKISEFLVGQSFDWRSVDCSDNDFNILIYNNEINLKKNILSFYSLKYIYSR